jgi:hypothetical protein
MISNEALNTNNQVKLFEVLAGVVFALIALTYTQGITLFFQLAQLFCFLKMIVSFAKDKLTL